MVIILRLYAPDSFVTFRQRPLIGLKIHVKEIPNYLGKRS
jgi:hypothetical protein